MENDLRSLELYRWNIVAIPSISILSLSLSPPLPPLSSRLDGVRVETRIYASLPYRSSGGGEGTIYIFRRAFDR